MDIFRCINKRNSYIKAMLKAINLARSESSLNPKSSMTDGLRVIRRFEKINNIKFDPFNKTHLNKIAYNGSHESFFRSMKILFKNMNK